MFNTPFTLSPFIINTLRKIEFNFMLDQLLSLLHQYAIVVAYVFLDISVEAKSFHHPDKEKKIYVLIRLCYVIDKSGLRFIIIFVQGVFDLQIYKRKKRKFVLNELRLWKNNSTYIVKIFDMGIVCTIIKLKYQTICAELAFAKVAFLMIFFL